VGVPHPHPQQRRLVGREVGHAVAELLRQPLGDIGKEIRIEERNESIL
jgi:hypothetical protein